MTAVKALKGGDYLPELPNTSWSSSPFGFSLRIP